MGSRAYPAQVKRLNALASCGALLALLAVNSTSHGDLPPPEGTKFVGYSFVLENVGAFPDFVVFAYPWSLSNGAPTHEHIRVSTDRPVQLGRRSPTPKLYAMPRGAYEAWEKTYKPKDDGEDPALEALVKRPDVVLCTGAPTPRFSLSSDDKREDILEKLSVKRIAAGVCEISTALSPTAEPEATPTPTAAPTPVAPDVPPTTNPTSAQDPAAPPGKSGCGSCSVGGADGADAIPDAAISAVVLGALFGRRRRRR